MATANPLQFIQQVRGEVAKIAWPSRRETLVTSLMVLLLAAVFGAFFSIVGILIRTGLQAILTYFGS